MDKGITETRTYTYVYDHEDIILEYLLKTPNSELTTTRYIHGPGIDEPISIERNANMYYYHADGLGSITTLTDQNQNIIESYTYSSFGEVKRKGDKVKNTITYTAREWDDEMGLYYSIGRGIMTRRWGGLYSRIPSVDIWLIPKYKTDILSEKDFWRGH